MRCFVPAWIGAWFTAVFLSSAIIACLGLSGPAAAIGTGVHRLPATVWKVADDVGPAVKLTIGALLLLSFLVLQRLSGPRTAAARYALSAGIGIAAMAVTIAIMPSTFSRGFAGALTGHRFDLATTTTYLLSGALAGVSFAFGIDRCEHRRRTSADPFRDGQRADRP